MRINVALQGGGSHGAFTWGTLDRLLEEDDLDIPAIVGTSAGAINATLLAAGLASGSRQGARDLLARFWQRLADIGRGPLPWSVPGWPAFPFPGSPSTLGWVAVEMWSRLFSPYQFNPFGWNPVRDLLRDLVPFEAMRAGETQLFLCATNVLTGKLRVFETPEIGPDHVLASACLPTLFQAVQIGEEYFWDGGYMGNPAIFPLIYHTTCSDVLIVHINPVSIEGVPTTPLEISDRINTLSFNSSLHRELRAIEFVSRLVEDGALDEARFRRLNIHVVEAEDVLRGLGALSKFNTDPSFIGKLHALGRARMDDWLARHREDVGHRSSVDVRSAFV
ncbi:patatin-like phospholipase family protein [Nostoc sp. NIES-2111]